MDVLTKADVLDTKIEIGGAYKYYVNPKNNKIEFLMVPNTTTSKDEYGVVADTWSTKDGLGAEYYVGTTHVDSCESDNVSVTEGTVLYKINKETNGKVKFTVTPTTSAVSSGALATSAEAVKISGSKVTYTTSGAVSITGTAIDYFAENVVVYIWDSAKSELSAEGSTADLLDNDNVAIDLYLSINAVHFIDYLTC